MTSDSSKSHESTRRLSRDIDDAFAVLKDGKPDAQNRLYRVLCTQAENIVASYFQPADPPPRLGREIATEAMRELDQFGGGRLSTWFSRCAHKEAKRALKLLGKERNKNEEIEAGAIPANDSQASNFFRWFSEETERLASEIDYSREAATKVLADFFAAKASLDRLCTEVVPDLSKFLAIAQQDAEIAAGLQNTMLDSVHLACYWLAVTQATTRLIFTRIKKNGTNSNFGFLLLGMRLGNDVLYEDCRKELHLIALSIPYKRKTWFHPDAPDIWRNLADKALATELMKHQNLEVSAILERMIENKFAYLYVAFECDFKDELKRLYRQRAREQAIPEEFEIDGSGTEAIGDDSGDDVVLVEEVEQGRRNMLKCIEQLAESPDLSRGEKELILQLKIHIEDPSKCFEEGHLGGRIMKMVAEKLGVTEQQARNYREKLNSRVETNEALAKIKDQLKSLRLSFLEAEDHEK